MQSSSPVHWDVQSLPCQASEVTQRSLFSSIFSCFVYKICCGDQNYVIGVNIGVNLEAILEEEVGLISRQVKYQDKRRLIVAISVIEVF